MTSGGSDDAGMYFSLYPEVETASVARGVRLHNSKLFYEKLNCTQCDSNILAHIVRGLKECICMFLRGNLISFNNL